jgi:hypothetical protein
MGTRRAGFRISYGLPSLVEIERDEGWPASPADGLFTATQRRVLAYLYGQPDQAFYVRELLDLTGAGNGAVQRELRRLQQAGLVRITREGARTYVQADASSPIHAELAALVRCSVGLAEPLRQAFALVEPGLRLCFAFEFGRELGLLILPKFGRMALAGIDPAREQAEQRLGRSLWMISVDEERLRGDAFVAEVLRRPRTWVFGNEALLAGLLAAGSG